MNRPKKETRYVLLILHPQLSKHYEKQRDLLRGIRTSLQDTKLLAIVMKDNSIYWPATQFLTSVSLRTSSRTGDTARTYGESIVTYLNYVSSEEIDLDRVCERTLQSYRNWLVDINASRKSLSPSTINLRLTITIMFHTWCEQKGILSSSVRAFRVLNDRVSNYSYRSIQKIPRGRIEKNLYIRNSQRIPRILDRDELKNLVKTAGQPYGLMIKWAVVTGMRRFEICQLKIEDLPPRRENQSSRLREMMLNRKGGSHCKIFIPNALVEETWVYIMFQRSVVASSSFIFLSRNGLPVQRGHLSKIFKKISLNISPGATFHHLRHTYAVVVLTMLQERAAHGESINPLKTLQVMMGHASIDTTEIYLRALDVHSEAVEQTLNYLYGEKIEEK